MLGLTGLVLSGEYFNQKMEEFIPNINIVANELMKTCDDFCKMNNLNIDRAIDAINSISEEFLLDRTTIWGLRRAIASNNWLKMHGIPMRRTNRIRKNRR